MPSAGVGNLLLSIRMQTAVVQVVERPLVKLLERTTARVLVEIVALVRAATLSMPLTGFAKCVASTSQSTWLVSF